MAEKTWVVVEAGGKQHLVTAGNHITVNRLSEKEGDVLKVTSMLDNSPVELLVKSHIRGPKINGIKFKNKVRYLKRYGHRQEQTVLEVIDASSNTSKKEAEPQKEPVKKSVKKVATSKKAAK